MSSDYWDGHHAHHDDLDDDPDDDLDDGLDDEHDDDRLERLARAETEELAEYAEEIGAQPKSIELPLDDDQYERAKQNASAVEHDYFRILQEYGYLAMVDAAFTESKNTGHPFHAAGNDLEDNSVWRKHGVRILASTSKPILTALLQGTLASGANNPNNELHYYFNGNSDPERQSEWYERKSEPFAPAIYVCMPADSGGESLTPFELRIVILRMRQYVSGDPQFHQQNAEIDCQSRGKSRPSDIARGRHFYLNGSSNRVLQILCWCFDTEAYLDREAPVWNPCQSQLRVKCRDREIFTRIGGGYHYTGRGFNIAPAGLSVSSGNLGNKLDGQAKADWDKTERYRHRDRMYYEQLNSEVEEGYAKYKAIGERRAEKEARKAQKQESIRSQFALMKAEHENTLRRVPKQQKAAIADTFWKIRLDLWRKKLPGVEPSDDL
ncbi:hypothetical protein EJ04DRAFT_578286 [Polyplosphaeria fusca]|uniref:Uncharacterized protein n=1 Tax=Polyplosphaeria fusca TaxID=682080 RepID=A0A9P4QRM0_9PLEO|nr:hypothetical protein EJ04DRAFT_578286 [Polyplosphaeria fusca]